MHNKCPKCSANVAQFPGYDGIMCSAGCGWYEFSDTPREKDWTIVHSSMTLEDLLTAQRDEAIELFEWLRSDSNIYRHSKALQKIRELLDRWGIPRPEDSEL